MRAGLGKAMRNYIDTHNLSPKGVTLTAEDIREGMTGVLSVFVAEPQFQGQTKDRLNNPEVLSAVDSLVRPALEHWLNHNRSVAESIVARVILAARAREASRAAQQEVTRKSATSGRLNLPGKLSDCTGIRTLRLGIVRRRRAIRRAARQSRGATATRQAILPLRGKVLNTESASLAKVLENKELSDLVTALGCGLGKNFDLARLRYGKLIILADADSDGNHIATLLLTFIYRHIPQLLKEGKVYLAQPPLYRIDIGKETFWALDDAQRDGDSEEAGQRPRQAGDHAVQGTRRDDAEGAVGDDAEPEDPAAAARRRVRPDRDRSGHQRADGQGRQRAFQVHHGTRGRGGGAGRIRGLVRADGSGRWLKTSSAVAPPAALSHLP